MYLPYKPVIPNSTFKNNEIGTMLTKALCEMAKAWPQYMFIYGGMVK
jgi:hypothetical protein